MGVTLMAESRSKKLSDEGGLLASLSRDEISDEKEDATSTKLFVRDSEKLARIAEIYKSSSAKVVRHLFRKHIDALYIKALDDERRRAADSA